MTSHSKRPDQNSGNKSTDRMRYSFMIVLTAFCLGTIVGSLNLFNQGLHAGVRPGQKREAFKSGGARSELVLKEISATLLRIEKRMEKIEERMVKQPQIRK